MLLDEGAEENPDDSVDELLERPENAGDVLPSNLGSVPVRPVVADGVTVGDSVSSDLACLSNAFDSALVVGEEALPLSDSAVEGVNIKSLPLLSPPENWYSSS